MNVYDNYDVCRCAAYGDGYGVDYCKVLGPIHLPKTNQRTKSYIFNF